MMLHRLISEAIEEKDILSRKSLSELVSELGYDNENIPSNMEAIYTNG